MNKKIILVMVLTITMLFGSLSMVSAGYLEVPEEFENTACTAYCDAYCLKSYGTASTCAYVDNTVSYARMHVDMKMYVVNEEYVDAGWSDELLKSAMSLYGTDSASSEAIYSGRISADAEVLVSSGMHGWKVESNHVISMNILNYISRSSLNVYY